MHRRATTILSALSCAALLGACANKVIPAIEWNKPEFRRDDFECPRAPEVPDPATATEKPVTKLLAGTTEERDCLWLKLHAVGVALGEVPSLTTPPVDHFREPTKMIGNEN